jgi:hypothetical protein
MITFYVAANVKGFDVVRRVDGSYAVYDYAWWPDEYLDADPEANADYLEGTQGWRAKGWQVVHVAANMSDAKAWCHANA